MSSPNGSAQFTIQFSAAIGKTIKRLHSDAAQQGRAAVQRLRSDPRTAGEPLFHLPDLKLEVRVLIVAPIVIEYAVHDHQPLVFLRTVRLI